jgi:hypothetical protein
MRHLLILVSCILLPGASLFSQQKQMFQLHPQNPHYFLYREKPLVLVGSGEHYGAVVNLDFDYRKYLRTLAADGMNTTRLFTGAYIEKLGDFGIARNTLAPAEGRLLLPWKRSSVGGYMLGGNKFDLNQWDDAYFTRLKDFVAEASGAGVIVEVTLFSSHYGGGWNYSPFNRKNNVNLTDSIASSLVNTLENGNILVHQEKYVRKLVRELNMFPNIYFEIQNEPWADQSDIVLQRNEYGPENDWRSTIQVVSARSTAWQRKVAEWIKEEEKRLANKHLISQNIGNFYYPVTAPDPNVAIFNFHYALPEAVTRNYHLQRPIGFNETGFAGRSDATYRRQAWRFMMAGGGLFNHLDYSFSAGGENGVDTTYKAPGGGSPELRKQFGILKNVMESLDFISLEPAMDFILEAPGASVFSMTDGRRQWMIYYEGMASKTYPIKLNLPKGSASVEWIDVVTGSRQAASPVLNGQLSVPEGTNEKVAIIRIAATKRQ